MIRPSSAFPTTSLTQFTPENSFAMNDLIALSHMKLAALSRDQRVDTALLHKSILIVNALEAHEAASEAAVDDRWTDQLPPLAPISASFVPPPAPKLQPIREEDPIDLDDIFLEHSVLSVPEPQHRPTNVEVVEVGESDDEWDDDDDDYSSMATSTHSIVSFSMDDTPAVYSPPSSPLQPMHELSFPPSFRPHAADSFSDDEDEDEAVTPPQPLLLDDFKGESDFGLYDADELEAVQGLRLFGAAPRP